MMKGNMAMIVPNIVMMPAVSYFFSGFLTAKIPFALTPRFKVASPAPFFLVCMSSLL